MIRFQLTNRFFCFYFEVFIFITINDILKGSSRDLVSLSFWSVISWIYFFLSDWKAPDDLIVTSEQFYSFGDEELI